MVKVVGSLILAGLMVGLGGCRADAGSRASSQMDEETGAGGSGAAPAPSALGPSAPAAKLRDAVDLRPLVVCFGDSLTAGYGADEGASYPDFLQKDLDKDGYRYRVVNEGVSGDTTKDGVDRLAGVVAMKPAVVVLEFGGNDGLRGIKTTVTRANLATMIEGLKGSGAKVVIAGITLPPDYGADYVSSFTANYPALGRSMGFRCCRFC